jgi:hypothetical protein
MRNSTQAAWATFVRDSEEKMNVTKALATVVGTALGFGAIGTAIGVFLGKVAPGFFRQMLPLRDPLGEGR